MSRIRVTSFSQRLWREKNAKQTRRSPHHPAGKSSFAPNKTKSVPLIVTQIKVGA